MTFSDAFTLLIILLVFGGGTAVSVYGFTAVFVDWLRRIGFKIDIELKGGDADRKK